MISGGGDRAKQLQPRSRVAEFLEKAGAAAQNHRYDVELQFIDEARGEILVDDGSAAADSHVLFASSPSRLLERGLESADSMPSVTKLNTVPPCIASGSRAWCVSTKTGVWKGGFSPHQPFQ